MNIELNVSFTFHCTIKICIPPNIVSIFKMLITILCHIRIHCSLSSYTNLDLVSPNI